MWLWDMGKRLKKENKVKKHDESRTDKKSNSVWFKAKGNKGFSKEF